MFDNIKKLNKLGALKFYNIKKIGLSIYSLKLIALITMVIDHVGVVFAYSILPYYEIFRGIGRISFPIYAFLIVEGFFHTSDRRKYATRLGVFALISEVPYDLAFEREFIDISSQNIFFTLLMGLLTIWMLNSIDKGNIRYPEKLLNKIGLVNLNSLARIIAMAGGCGIAYLLEFSYSYAGVFLIICFYVFYEHHVWKMFGNAFFNIGLYGGLQSLGTISIIPIALYNGKPGKRNWKWFFYVAYPAHLLGLVIVKYIF